MKTGGSIPRPHFVVSLDKMPKSQMLPVPVPLLCLEIRSIFYSKAMCQTDHSCENTENEVCVVVFFQPERLESCTCHLWMLHEIDKSRTV